MHHILAIILFDTTRAWPKSVNQLLWCKSVLGYIFFLFQLHCHQVWLRTLGTSEGLYQAAQKCRLPRGFTVHFHSCNHSLFWPRTAYVQLSVMVLFKLCRYTRCYKSQIFSSFLVNRPILFVVLVDFFSPDSSYLSDIPLYIKLTLGNLLPKFYHKSFQAGLETELKF